MKALAVVVTAVPVLDVLIGVLAHVRDGLRPEGLGGEVEAVLLGLQCCWACRPRRTAWKKQLPSPGTVTR